MKSDKTIEIFILVIIVAVASGFLFAQVKASLFLNKKPLGLTDGLVGHWTFDGKDMYNNVADVSGQGNTGYLNGQISTTTVRGKLGQALEFDGVDDYVVVSGFSGVTSILSVSAWIKADSLPEWGTIAKDWVSAGNEKFHFGLDGSAGDLSVYIKQSNGTQIGPVREGSGNPLPIDKFQHVVFVVDGSYVRLYRNGVEIGAPVPYDGTINIGSSYTGIGAKLNADGIVVNTSPGYWDGTIDDVRIYNRALSADEVRKLYNSGESKFNTSKKKGLTDGLVGHWTFDGKDMYNNVADVSGQGNTGYLNGQTSTTTVRGKLGQALDFDGVDDYVDVEDSASLDITGNLTISGWFYTTETTEDVIVAGKIYYNSSGDNGGYAIRKNGTKWEIDIANNTWGFVYKSGAVVVNTWQHVVGVYDGSTVIDLYIDGVLQTGVVASVAPTSIKNVSNSFGLASSVPSSYWINNFNGKIDDVRIYNRALSADEVRKLYNSGESKFNTSKKKGLTDGLVGHWTFDGKNMYNNVADVSGQGNTGYLTNFTSTTTARGKLGQALEFDGVDDYVSVSAPQYSSPIASWSAWIYKDTLGTYQDIITEGADSRFWFGENTPAGLIKAKIYTGATSAFVELPSVITAGEWQHVAVTYDKVNLKIYLNGAEQASVAHSDDLGVATSWRDVKIGRGTVGRYFDGTIDDVRIYNRALSADEVRKLYNSGR